MKAPDDIDVLGFSEAFATEVVKMWGRSFQRAMGLEEHNRYEEFKGQVSYFVSLSEADMWIVIRTTTSKVVGFMELENDYEITQLYIDVDEQGKGYGSFLLNEAKKKSPGTLELYTFQKNTAAAIVSSICFEEGLNLGAKKATRRWLFSYWLNN